MAGVPALNVNFTDEEMEQLRTAAASGELSLRAFVHRAALDAASDHKRRVRAAARIVAERSAELNRRLA
ncbi:Antitoxin Phd [Mycobacterium sp. THAF192]|nr:Antitoxin Phd [Mycobacterium sp. THAF192]